MMREDIRKKRVEEFGSFLYCPERDTICSFRDTEDGTCGRTECLHEDIEWLKLQERIAENRKKNSYPTEEPQTNIRTQNKTAKEILQRAIERKSAEARRCYKKGWTKKGDRLTYELIHLERKLKETEKQHDRFSNKKDNG